MVCSYFDIVTQNLRAQGAITLDEFSALSAGWGSGACLNDSVTAVDAPPQEETRHAIRSLDTQDEVEVVNNCSEPTPVPKEDAHLEFMHPNSKLGPAYSLTIERPINSTSAQIIRDACAENARAGLTTHCYTYMGSDTEAYGAAVEIRGPGLKEPWSYSTDAIYPNAHDAQDACCKMATEAGLLQNIRCAPPLLKEASCNTSPSLERGITMEEFAECLLRHSRGHQTDHDTIEGSTSLVSNRQTTLLTWQQLANQARGSQLVIQRFFWSRVVNGRTLHGSLLRLDRPSETISYIVDACFKDPSEAKEAATLIAFSRGAETRLRSLRHEVESRLDERDRLICMDLLSVLGGFKEDVKLEYLYDVKRQSHGATLNLYRGTALEGPPAYRWTVYPGYASKSDAKYAVTILAGKTGIVESIQLRGQPLPPGRKAWWDCAVEKQTRKQEVSLKRPQAEAAENEIAERPTKKRRQRKKSKTIIAQSTAS